jgi:hypothetical protein
MRACRLQFALGTEMGLSLPRTPPQSSSCDWKSLRSCSAGVPARSYVSTCCAFLGLSWLVGLLRWLYTGVSRDLRRLGPFRDVKRAVGGCDFMLSRCLAAAVFAAGCCWLRMVLLWLG